MVAAFFRAFAQLPDPRIVRLLVGAVVLALLVFAALWGGIAWLLANTALAKWHWVDALLQVFGGFAALGLCWFLFPVVASALIGLFLGAAANAVEARHYPGLPPAPGLPVLASLLASLRFLLVTLVLDLLLLPCLWIPVLFPWVWWAVNGYLIGRAYFELAALRRLDVDMARALRRRHRLRVFGAGLLTAGLLLVPVLNLLAPVIATMAMVHLVERWRPHPA
jgi:CysZ protein